jgi:anti-anti-sigma factor
VRSAAAVTTGNAAWADPAPDGRPGPPGFAAVVVDGTVMAVLSGDLDAGTRHVLAHHLAQIARLRPERIIFEMSGVGFADCAAMRLVVGAGGSLPAGVRPVLNGPGPGPRRVLELTGLDACCDILP